jgi:hypothetical protein
MKKSFIVALGLIIFTAAIMPSSVFAEDENGATTEVAVEAETPVEEPDVDVYDPPPPPDEDDDPDAPIDGGVVLLIAGGIGYGVKKYRAGRSEKPKQ